MEDKSNKILERLNEKKRHFEEALQRLMEGQREYNDHLCDDNITDESDRAQRETSAQSSYGLIERKAREVKMVEQLIRKISEEEKCCECEECGEPIPLERLLIVPEARLCVSCQRELERIGRIRNASRGFLSHPYLTKDNQGEALDEIDDFSDDMEYELTDSEIGVRS